MRSAIYWKIQLKRTKIYSLKVLIKTRNRKFKINFGKKLIRKSKK